MGPATDVMIGRPGTHTTEWIPIPATRENREIVRKIEDILFRSEKL